MDVTTGGSHETTGFACGVFFLGVFLLCEVCCGVCSCGVWFNCCDCCCDALLLLVVRFSFFVCFGLFFFVDEESTFGLDDDKEDDDEVEVDVEKEDDDDDELEFDLVGLSFLFFVLDFLSLFLFVDLLSLLWSILDD